MQDRHINRERYFHEQSFTTEKYMLPYIRKFIQTNSEWTVMEIGCGEGGNLKPFLDIGCSVVGIDQAENKITNAERFFNKHPLKNNLKLIADDIFNVNPCDIPSADLIIIKDTIEHIHDHDYFLKCIKGFIKPSGRIFLSFPPWAMPFGGHQQMCESSILSRIPYFHLLPLPLYRIVLKMFGESETKISGLVEIRATRISVNKFRKIVAIQNYKVDHEIFYLINPNYDVKFNMKARVLPKPFNVPFLREFITTTYYCIISLNEN